MEDRENTPILVTGIPAPQRPRSSRSPSRHTPSPHKYTQTHPYRAPRPRVAGVGGGRGLGEKGASFPFRPEVVLPRNSSHQQRTRRRPQGGFPGLSRGPLVPKGGGRLPGKGGRAQLRSEARRGAGRFRNWKWKELLPGALRTPLGATQSGYPGNRRRRLSRDREVGSQTSGAAVH